VIIIGGWELAFVIGSSAGYGTGTHLLTPPSWEAHASRKDCSLVRRTPF
jgi:hypothetical protein